MEKEQKFDKTLKKIEGITDKINVIMKNRSIIAIFLIVDGITFLLNPNGSLQEMARSIILLVVLASFSTLLANLSTKIKDMKSIIFKKVIKKLMKVPMKNKIENLWKLKIILMKD